MKTLTYLSPAKINLFLHITGRRPDGYHNLQTVFQFLDYCDELSFTRREDAQIMLNCNDKALATADNLVVRAANLLQKISGTTLGVDIHLQKKIPVGGGLGGGSSNTATTLVALNRLWQLQLTPGELARLGLQLGADVPIFLYGKAAWAEGVGEKLEPVVVDEPWYVVVVPPCAVATAEIFSAVELTRNTPAITIQQFLTEPETTQNDCGPVVRKRYPIVAEALDWLDQFATARLTGTGGCIFAAVDTLDYAKSILQHIPKPLDGFVAKGLNISPLF